MTPSVICTSEQQNEAINFEPHRVSDRQGILGCFHKLENQDFSGDHAEAVFFREIFYSDDGWVHELKVTGCEWQAGLWPQRGAKRHKKGKGIAVEDEKLKG